MTIQVIDQDGNPIPNELVRIGTPGEERETHQLEVHTGEENPVEGVDVTIERWDGATTIKTTDEEGTASFEVYPGEYTITSEYDGDTHTETVTVENDSSVSLPFERPPTKLRYP